MRELTDVHVHLAALPTPENGCHVSRLMLRHPLTRFVAWRLGLPMDEPRNANLLYVRRLVGLLRASRRVKRAVVLAMDGIYDGSGRLDRERTSLYVPNDYALEVCRENPELRPGVSVNPARRDAIDELERCAARGAALVKLLPNSQGFDPADPRFRPYWKALARLRLPLLSHIGYEFSLIGRDQSVGEPGRLRPALEAGVTVIGAHGVSHGLFVYEKHLGTFLELVRRFPNFYSDTSALTLPNRCRMLLLLRRHPELMERLVFGTDYPLPVMAFPALAAGLGAYAAARGQRNPFDRQAEVLDRLGVAFRDLSEVAVPSS